MTSSKEPLTIALVGAGLIGPRHALSIIKTPGITLHSIVDPSSASASWASSIDTPHFSSISALLSSTPLPTAALIATPNSTHVPIATDLANAGIHLLIEKPLCTTLDSGRALVALAAEKQIKILVGHHRRFNPHVVLMHSLVSSGALGTVLAISGLWTLRKQAEYFDAPTEWRRGATAGVVMINMVHEVDILQFCFGRIVRVHAEEVKRTRGFEADEGAAIILKFDSGVVGTFVVCDATPSLTNFEGGTGENPTIYSPDDGVHEGRSEFYRVFGTKGSMAVGRVMRVYSYHSDGDGWCHELKEEIREVKKEVVAFDEQMRHFVRILQNEEEPRCRVDEGLNAVVVCEAIKKAMKTGQPVEINSA